MVHWSGLSTAEQNTWKYGTNDDARRQLAVPFIRAVLVLVTVTDFHVRSGKT
jgi:hypothetical protein